MSASPGPDPNPNPNPNPNPDPNPDPDPDPNPDQALHDEPDTASAAAALWYNLALELPLPGTDDAWGELWSGLGLELGLGLALALALAQTLTRRAVEWVPRPTHASRPAPPGRPRRTPRDRAAAAAVRRPAARAGWR